MNGKKAKTLRKIVKEQAPPDLYRKFYRFMKKGYSHKYLTGGQK